jgi:HD superfamily phosphohydrolase YqeK
MIEITSNYDYKALQELNFAIHGECKHWEYHELHAAYVAQYACLVAERLGATVEPDLLRFIAWGHDLMKEHKLDNPKIDRVDGHEVPHDLNKYVRNNIDVLEEYSLGDYFNSDMQLHAQAAAIFLRKEYGINSPYVFLPIAFHSCPIYDVYMTLPEDLRQIIDIIMLSDKLSSNFLKINRHYPARIDLELAVFGPDGKEFNYSLGLVIARIISQGGNPGEQAVKTTEYYYERLINMNPFVPSELKPKLLGVKKIWEPRKSRVLEM